MTKYEQKHENRKVEEILDSITIPNYATWTQLRSCSAEVAQCGRFTVLRSYNTIVAAIDTTTGICYDFLRKVYGYTATSAQHISKFKRDYHATDCKTWREV